MSHQSAAKSTKKSNKNATFCLSADADSMCPTELNPLVLDPSEVIGKYGESFLVNCSSEVEDHYGMYWRHGNIDTDIEDENRFIPSSVSLSRWNVTAECRIKLNDTLECSKNLEITIYSKCNFKLKFKFKVFCNGKKIFNYKVTPFSNFVLIENPESVNMYPARHVKSVVEGTPYELQCDVLDVAPVRNLTVTWYKDNQTVKTDTFNSTTKEAEDVSSTLTFNISRGGSGAQFRCEAQLDLGPYGPQPPVISETHSISVHCE